MYVQHTYTYIRTYAAKQCIHYFMNVGSCLVNVENVLCTIINTFLVIIYRYVHTYVYVAVYHIADFYHVDFIFASTCNSKICATDFDLCLFVAQLKPTIQCTRYLTVMQFEEHEKSLFSVHISVSICCEHNNNNNNKLAIYICM